MKSEIFTLFRLKDFTIQKDLEKTPFRVKVSNTTIDYDTLLSSKIDLTWKNKMDLGMYDNETPLFSGKLQMNIVDGNLEMDVDKGNFKETFFFNRTIDGYSYLEKLSKLGVFTPTHLSTHYHILTKDSKILFAKKTNQNNEMSGFGGFFNLKEDTIKTKLGTYLDLHSFLLKNMDKEVGRSVREKISKIDLVGATYVSKPGFSGADLNFLIEVNLDSDKIIELFETSDQFSDKKGIVAVDFNPIALSEFVKSTFKSGGKVSLYAMGCQAILLENYFDFDSRIFIDTINMFSRGYSASPPDFMGIGFSK